MKNAILLLSCFLFTSIICAQSDVTIKDSKDKAECLNTTKLDYAFNPEGLNDMLDEPLVYTEFKDSEKVDVDVLKMNGVQISKTSNREICGFSLSNDWIKHFQSMGNANKYYYRF